ncbi:hypothetical protein [Deinococcus navajonensis]|uniref:Uncharacterized protein n=1 Tax=Deinococcus navajonensis TaxID=309884 RepID=A0ABV8XTV3_9DEIO
MTAFLTNAELFRLHLEDDTMTILTNYAEARAAFRGAVLNARFTPYAEEAKRTHLTAIPADMRYPGHIDPAHFNADARLVDLDRTLSERIAAGITAATFPDLDTITPVRDSLLYEAAMRSFLLAGGAVASALALYGKQDERRDPAAWRRVCPFSPWPPEALAALETAHQEAARLAPVWLGHVALSHRFLPGYGA